MRIVVIEPHPDDAMLNTYGFITRSLSEKIAIFQVTMTAQKEDPRAALNEEYGKGFDQINMGSEGIDWTLKGRRRYEEQYGRAWMLPDMLRTIFQKQNDRELFEVVEDAIGVAGTADFFLLPMGQIHPMHRLVYEEFIKRLDPDKVLVYSEFPYFTRVRGTTHDKRIEDLELCQVESVILSDAELKAKDEAIYRHYPLGHLYMVRLPQAIEHLREERFFTCPTTDS